MAVKEKLQFSQQDVCTDMVDELFFHSQEVVSQNPGSELIAASYEMLREIEAALQHIKLGLVALEAEKSSICGKHLWEAPWNGIS